MIEWIYLLLGGPIIALIIRRLLRVPHRPKLLHTPYARPGTSEKTIYQKRHKHFFLSRLHWFQQDHGTSWNWFQPEFGWPGSLFVIQGNWISSTPCQKSMKVLELSPLMLRKTGNNPNLFWIGRYTDQSMNFERCWGSFSLFLCFLFSYSLLMECVSMPLMAQTLSSASPSTGWSTDRLLFLCYLHSRMALLINCPVILKTKICFLKPF